MRRYLILLSFILVLACAPAGLLNSGTEPTAPPGEVASAYAGLRLDALGSYHATFEIRFDGDSRWVYSLETRRDDRGMSHDLHLEGLDASQNPGDVRLVTDGTVTQMRGPGTGDECIQFPNDLDLSTSLLTPDDLLAPEQLTVPLDAAGAETVAGREAQHYTLRQTSADEWRDVSVDLWLDEATGAVLRYELQARAPDPLFQAGEGAIWWMFRVQDAGPQVIEPIAGCEIDLPLPRGATRLIRLPGLVAFDAAISTEEIVAFYRSELPQAGWELQAEPELGAYATLLSYRRGEEVLDVNIEDAEDTAHVELLLDSP